MNKPTYRRIRMMNEIANTAENAFMPKATPMRNYRYNPDSFIGIMRLSDDLNSLYFHYERYAQEKTQPNRFALERCGEDLFFTLKHSKLEGTITCDTADEILAYAEELIYG